MDRIKPTITETEETLFSYKIGYWHNMLNGEYPRVVFVYKSENMRQETFDVLFFEGTDDTAFATIFEDPRAHNGFFAVTKLSFAQECLSSKT